MSETSAAFRTAGGARERKACASDGDAGRFGSDT